MANKRITELPTAGIITGAELVPVIQNGETRKSNVSSILAGVEASKVGFADLESGTISPKFNSVKLSMNPIIETPEVGEFYYDAAEQTATLNLGTTELQVGQEMYIRCKNNTASTITDGSVVYISGASGSRPTVSLAKADVAITATTVLGVATEPIAPGEIGSITINGIVHGLNTSAYAEGTLLYLSSATAGAYTSTAPGYPNRVVEVGRVLRQHATEGQILVKVVVNYSEYLKGDLASQSSNTLGAGLIGFNASYTYPVGTVGSYLNSFGTGLVTLDTTQTVTNKTFSTGCTWGGNAVPIEKGGTNATSASGARTNLGLAIGTNVQAYSPNLNTIAGLTPTDSYIIVGDGANWVTETGSTARASLGLRIGTDVQAYDANIAKINSAQTWTATQTFKGVVETVFSVVDGAGVVINPADGTIQTWTLGANRTPTVSFPAGGSVTLMISAGVFTVDWTTAAISWVGGSAPVLSTTGYSVVVLWKVGTTMYGSYVGDV